MNKSISNLLFSQICGIIIILFSISCQNENTQTTYDSIPIDSLEMEEEISIFPSQLSYSQIESFYLNFKDYESDIDLTPVMIQLQTYFEEMKKGVNPFEIFEDPSIDKLSIDTSTLFNFLKELAPVYSNLKKNQPEIFGMQEWDLNISMTYPQKYFYFNNEEEIKDFILRFEKISTTSGLQKNSIFKDKLDSQFYGTYNLFQQIRSDSIQFLGYIIAKIDGKMKDWNFNMKPNEIVYFKTYNPRVQFWNGIRIGKNKVDIINSMNLEWKEKDNLIIVKNGNEGFFILDFDNSDNINEIKYIKSKYQNWNSFLRENNFSRIISVN